MSFIGFGKNAGPDAPPSSNPFAANFPRATTQPSFRPTEPTPKWGHDEYPSFNEVCDSQTNQKAAVIPFSAVHTAGSRNLIKSSHVEEQKGNRSLPSLFPDEGTLRHSTTLTGRSSSSEGMQ